MPFAQPIKQMGKNILNKILIVVIMVAVAELGAVFGMFVVKSHFFASSFNPLDIHGLPGAYTVTSGSMEPAIPTGALVLSVPVSDYKAGDVITFRNSADSKTLITHRIQANFYSDESKEFIYYTKGDANKSLDGAKIKNSEIVGKTIIGIPFFGYAANSVKDPKMFILFVIVPITVIVYEELRFLRKELSKLIKIYIKKVKPKFDKFGDDFNDAKGINKSAILIPLVAITLVLSGITGSFFKDSDISFGKTFTTGNFPTPIPTATPIPTSSPIPTATPIPTTNPTPTAIPIAQTLVINEVLPHSSCTSGNTEGQFVELWNGTNGTVNLKNFQLSDGVNTLGITNSNTNIATHTFAILVKSGGVVNSCLGDIHSATTVNLGSSVNINAGTLRLLDASNNVIDTVQWGGTPNPAPLVNQSIERNPTGLDSATGINFNPSDFLIRSTPRPGQ